MKAIIAVPDWTLKSRSIIAHASSMIAVYEETNKYYRAQVPIVFENESYSISKYHFDADTVVFDTDFLDDWRLSHVSSKPGMDVIILIISEI